MLVVALGLFLFYLCTPSRNHVYADDSLPYSLATLTGSLYALEGSTINVHHLILAVLHGANRALGFTASADFAASALLFRAYVAATAFLALFLVGTLALRWFRSTSVAVVTMLLCAFTYGFWSYSITTDLYVPGVAFVLLAIDLAERSYRSRRPAAWLIAAGLAVLAASLNHQAYCLVAAPIAFVLLFGRRAETPARERVRRGAAFLATALASGLAVFFAAFRLSPTGGSFLAFVRGYSAWMTLMPTDKRVGPLTPIYALVGIARTLFFTDYLLRFQGAYEAIQRAFPWKLLFDDRFLIRRIPTALVAADLALMGLASATFVAAIALAARRLARARRADPGFWMLGGWVVAQMLLFSWWEPTSNEFWIWLMPALALLATGPAIGEPRSGRGRWLPWCLAASLFAINAPAVSRYWSRGNCVYAINKDYLSRVRPEDLVIASETYAIIGQAEQMARAGRAGDGPPPTVTFAWGDFHFDDPRLEAGLERVRLSGGTVFLDPTLGMPESAELSALAYERHRDLAQVDAELLRLERGCAERGIRLVGVRRKGEGVVTFRERKFAGHLEWMNG